MLETKNKKKIRHLLRSNRCLKKALCCFLRFLLLSAFFLLLSAFFSAAFCFFSFLLFFSIFREKKQGTNYKSKMNIRTYIGHLLLNEYLCVTDRLRIGYECLLSSIAWILWCLYQAPHFCIEHRCLSLFFLALHE